MNFIDLKEQNNRIKNEIANAINSVIDRAGFIKGKEVESLEKNLCEYSGSSHCTSVANGTDALLISLQTLGISIGDEVIMPSFTYISCAETVSLLGAKPVFVDVNKEDFNLIPKEVEKKINNKTKAIIAVSLFGQCPDWDELLKISKSTNIPIIEDAAQSFGAEYKSKKSCNFADISTTSFFPSKPLGCYGDGGAIFTNNEEFASKIKRIANHGQSERYVHTEVGVNSRLDSIQAAILNEKLKIFDDEIQKKNEIADKYSSFFISKGLDISPKVHSHNLSVFAQYTLKVPNRKNIIEALTKNKIPYAIHYPISIHKQKAYSQNIKLPNSEELNEEVLSLPMHAYLKEEDIDKITSIVYQSISK